MMDKSRQVRLKQFKRVAVRFLIISSILLFGGYLLFQYINSRPSVGEETEEPETNITEETNETLCLSSSISQLVFNSLDEKLPDKYKLERGDVGIANCDKYLTNQTVDSNRYSAHFKRVFVPVARVDSSTEQLTWEQLETGLHSSYIGENRLLWSSEAGSFLDSRYKMSVKLLGLQVEEIVSRLKEDNTLIGIIPLQEVTPHLKVIALDGQSPLTSQFFPFTYPLTELFWSDLTGEDEIKVIVSSFEDYFGAPDFDTSQIESVLLTGRSAVGARGFHNSEEIVHDPFKSIEGILSSSHITHLNNEVSEVEGCNQQSASTLLCAKPGNIDLIIDKKFDLIGLNGAGILDYDREPFIKSIEKYHEGKLHTYGGGINRVEALKPANVQLPNSGLNISMTGFSLVTPTVYLATNNSAGNVAPDTAAGNMEHIESVLTQILDTSWLAVDMQWGSSETDTVSETERLYAQKLVAEGADIVIGTNSTRIKQMEFIENVPVFYGLGLFAFTPDSVDQYEGIALKNYFYNGQYLGFELIPLNISNTFSLSIDMDTKAEILNTVYSSFTLDIN